MPTELDENGLEIKPTVTLSKREREFALRLLNKDISLSVSDEDIISHLSNNSNILINRANCGLGSPLISFEGKVTPRELIISSIKSECINETNFSWIDTKNDRLCNYAWSYIRSLTTLSFMSPSTMDVGVRIDGAFEVTVSMHPYNIWNLDSCPTNNISKKNCIISFFDILNTTNEQKIKDVNYLKTKWQIASQKGDAKLWMDKCDDKWAWSYLFENIKTGSNRPPIWFINKDNSSTIKDCIITLFDLLNEIPTARELMLRKMKSAWSQKSFRDKNNGKKSVSVVLPEKTISMLDEICIKNDRRKNEVIIRLIQEEYEQIKKGGH
ncbi:MULTISPECIES: hypothetical protein [Aeromonas]|uniref:hypothetical protein n=1 Tax=Aeromonas TaxID=642 RepID=UPI0012F156B4|nr:hypothetical protein [Aeromonas salmonicida]VXA80188.1 conserved hypothetical protein [Aeromonas salmonicida]